MEGVVPHPAETQEIELREHPIMIVLQDAVAGNGFLAGITLTGRTLMRQEDDNKWWMYGVCPGGIAESGNTVDEAFSRFRSRYKETLFDIAQESKDYPQFVAEVKRFFAEVDEEDRIAWDNALKAIRNTNIAPPEPFSKLPRVRAESRCCKVEVERLDQKKRFRPKDNLADEYLRAA
jgi:predicted RNase H-like HicB family nuclease